MTGRPPLDETDADRPTGPPTPVDRLYAIVEQGLCTGCGICQSVAGPEVVRVHKVANGYERPVVVGVMPLVALEVMETKQAVTKAYLVGGCLALIVTLNVGRLESWMPRRWVVTGGLLSLVAGRTSSCSWTIGCWASASAW